MLKKDERTAAETANQDARISSEENQDKKRRTVSRKRKKLRQRKTGILKDKQQPAPENAQERMRTRKMKITVNLIKINKDQPENLNNGGLRK